MVTSTVQIPENLIVPRAEFAANYLAKVADGRERLRNAKVAFVGLARNCAPHLAGNLHRLLQLTESCKEWRLHVETNDNEDDTDQVLIDFCSTYKQATFTSQRLGRQQLSTEFAGPRTIALAEYRTACQQWVRENALGCDCVCIIDFDAWAGWHHEGVLNGMGWLAELRDAYGMTSVSLLQTPQLGMGEDRKPKVTRGWAHYDAWALRLNSTWDDYTSNQGGWKHQWLPPVGSQPVRVCSAFGGMAIYRTDAYLAGVYDGATDCEHVSFHDSIAKATGKSLYLCPGMRTIMRWMEPDDGGQHSDD